MSKLGFHEYKQLVFKFLRGQRAEIADIRLYYNCGMSPQEAAEAIAFEG